MAFENNTKIPTDYTIEGSNDDTDWTVLKTVVGNTTFGKGSVNGAIELANVNGNYRYYKINVTKVTASDSTYVAIANVALTNENGAWLTADSDWSTFLPTPNSGAVVTGV